ncbi:MAG TPA: hypothetical protein VKU19_01260 [Bryobacteraceae bacterium]|nr:hypothetical protein [Bryobacteraceae bacterium]
MNNRILLASVGLALALVPRLPAQGNTAELFGGYTYAHVNPEVPLANQNANGWVGSAGGYFAKWFGAGAEISAVFGDIPAPSGVSSPSLHFKEYSYLAGPQFRFLDKARVQSAAKILLGGVFGQVNLDTHTSPAAVQALASAGYGGFNQTKFAMLVAVPVDVTVSKLIAVRVEPGLYVTDFSKQKQSNFRFSVGPVFRFGGAH